jgi:hypothetical protein
MDSSSTQSLGLALATTVFPPQLKLWCIKKVCLYWQLVYSSVDIELDPRIHTFSPYPPRWKTSKLYYLNHKWYEILPAWGRI